MKLNLSIILFIAMLILITGCSNNEDNNEKKTVEPKQAVEEKVDFKTVEAKAKQFEQIQGIGYPGNDEGLYIATPEGIKMFRENKWLENSTQNYDYFGLSAINNGVFISGVKNAESDQPQPLGIVKSTDKGATLESVAFQDQIAFQFLSVGYETEEMYIINVQESDDIGQGVFHSTNGVNWEPVTLKGIESDTLGMIAPHPTDSSIMAMATRSGIYFSKDKGENVEKITEPFMVTALAFSEDSLYYSAVEDENISLYEVDLESFESKKMDIPFLKYDNPITYISVNHKTEQTVAFTTYLSDVYETKNSGKSWSLLLSNGRIE
ncbi:hypothetical protein [Cytobacillus purgationiresistens]|uniref:Sortilin N-terminal domain-containing protein n=1 Tax=Cytobacillus purgationiresistens TaxID=863449 RepID=A0ABU0AET3_9BACI|nr:hypothetical protein [Cytobacillus purgationiresistens]MDQ0269535.1 hypothetical protein [Cytobacillus purgationiresistens]